jgi:hypothetical protein
VVLVRTDVSEEYIALSITVERISELGTTLLVNANVVPSSLILFILVIEEMFSCETPVLTRSTRRYISEDGILRSHHRGKLKSYIALTGWTL